MRFDRLRLRTSLKSSAARAACVWLLLASGITTVSFAQKLDDGDGAFRTGRYRDLFAEQGHPPAETKAKIEKAFQQLFHGDALSERVYFEAGSNAAGPLAYVTDWANNDARSEGMSYGMMIAVQLDKKREFDALWNWSNTYMLITDPKNPNVGYFARPQQLRHVASRRARRTARPLRLRLLAHGQQLVCGL